MNVSMAWVKGLNIPSDELSHWQQSVPEGKSLLLWCIENGKFSVETYLHWAREHFGLPSLHSTFFGQNQNSTFEKYKSHYNWDHQAYPIGEWDDVLYVACSQPIEDFKLDVTTQFILASPVDLASHFPTVTNLENSFTEMPPTPEVQIQPQASNDPADILQAEPQAEELPEEEPPEQLDAPEGMFGDSAPPEIKLDFSQIGVPSEAIAEDEVDTQVTGQSLKIEVPELNLGEVSEAPKLDLPIAPEGATPLEPSISSSSDPLEIPETQSGLIKTVTAPIDMSSATSQEDVTAFVFNELKQEYDGSMVLVYQGDELKPWKWDESWKPISKEVCEQAINVHDPSAFRIVHRTKLPYHGYVIDSEYNKQFFTNWGLKGIPETLTLIPLKQGDAAVFGILLCIGAKDKANNSTLVFAERNADELLTSIGKAGRAA